LKKVNKRLIKNVNGGEKTKMNSQLRSLATSRSGIVSRIIEYLKPGSAGAFLLAAVFVGLGTSLGGVLFIGLIDWVTQFFFDWLPGLFPQLGLYWLIFIPMLGGLLTGPIINYFAKEAKGHGVPEVMQAIALNGGRIRPQVSLVKVLASSICIGSGGSVGREGPIVQVGAALGSSVAQLLHMSESRIRALVACGAAAGIAATFNAPIAGVLFAVEVILGELHMRDIGSVVLSSIMASTVARSILGNRPAFIIPAYSLHSPWEIVFYLLLGILGAFVGVIFIRVLYAFEDLFDNWKFPDTFKPAIGGILLGLLGLVYAKVLSNPQLPVGEMHLGLPLIGNVPHIFSTGFPAIEQALLGKVSLGLMLALVVLKMLATSFTLGSGSSGGVFAPALFMGAMAGGAFGWVIEQIFPGATAGVGSYATVGMAAVFAAAARAPLTAILIVFEMTDDVHILLPLMAAVIVSIFVAEVLHKESIYTLKLVRRGIQLFRGKDMDVMAAVKVGEVMDHELTTVTPDLSVRELNKLYYEKRKLGFPVLDEKGILCGVVSLSDIRRVAGWGDPPDGLFVRDIATRNLVTAFPDETLGTVIPRMANRDVSRILVVDRDNPHHLVGVLCRENIVHAYELGVMRRGYAIGHLPGDPEGTASSRYYIDEHSSLVNRDLAEIHFPDDYLVNYIVRGGKTIVPHGKTRFKAGDIVTLIAPDQDEKQLETFWQEIEEQFASAE
jgi:CIC family chloride channel protein